MKDPCNVETIHISRYVTDHHCIEPIRRRTTCRYRIVSALEPNRLVPERRQHLFVAQQAFALDDQHRLAAPERQRSCRRSGDVSQGRQPRLEAAAVSGFALHVHRTVMVTNDFVHGRKAKPGSGLACREERLKQSLCYTFVETASRVGNRKTHEASWRQLAVAQRERNSHVLRLPSDLDGSAVLHRLRRVG